MSYPDIVKSDNINSLYVAGAEAITATALGIGVEVELLLGSPKEVLATTVVALGTLALDSFRRVNKFDRTHRSA